MRHTLFQGWTENQMKAEFARATAELAGLTQRKKDAAHRQAKAAAMMYAYKHATNV